MTERGIDLPEAGRDLEAEAEAARKALSDISAFLAARARASARSRQGEVPAILDRLSRMLAELGRLPAMESDRDLRKAWRALLRASDIVEFDRRLDVVIRLLGAKGLLTRPAADVIGMAPAARQVLLAPESTLEEVLDGAPSRRRMRL